MGPPRDSLGPCADCTHDEDEHGCDGCQHDWPEGAALAVLSFGVSKRPVTGCQCRGFVPQLVKEAV